MRLRGPLLALAALLLASCSTPPLAPTPTPAPAAVAPPAAPAHLRFAAIGVDADVTPTGLDPTGHIQVPALTDAAQIDYLNWSASMGANRPVTLLSHVNGRSSTGQAIPGGFLHLDTAKTGDPVDLTRSDGSTLVYRVTTVRLVDKTAFPTSIYDSTSTPTLVMITCGGVLDHAAHSYESNVLVTATLT